MPGYLESFHSQRTGSIEGIRVIVLLNSTLVLMSDCPLQVFVYVATYTAIHLNVLHRHLLGVCLVRQTMQRPHKRKQPGYDCLT